MRTVILLLLILSCALPAVAGDPGPDFWTLVEIRKANWAIDDETTKVAEALRKNKLNAAQAKLRWVPLHRKASQLKSRSLSLESGEQPEAAREVTKMMRLQLVRLEGLVKAARVESKSGLQAARPLWAKQVKSYKAYHAQEQKVLDLMNWIENNP